ncbi:MAG: hypothetical protein L3K19_03195 [Thermoplasmata archaeon]|nr:hypothetical protein [Thermoplasmata archaeon]
MPGSIPPAVHAPDVLREEPHAHMVCRNCGRIASVTLTQLDLFELERLAGRRPPRWSVDGVTFSLTGLCPNCRTLRLR